jgi:hypothetical protein
MYFTSGRKVESENQKFEANGAQYMRSPMKLKQKEVFSLKTT